MHDFITCFLYNVVCRVETVSKSDQIFAGWNPARQHDFVMMTLSTGNRSQAKLKFFFSLNEIYKAKENFAPFFLSSSSRENNLHGNSYEKSQVLWNIVNDSVNKNRNLAEKVRILTVNCVCLEWWGKTEPSLRPSHHHRLDREETAEWKSGVWKLRESRRRGSWLPETAGGGEGEWCWPPADGSWKKPVKYCGPTPVSNSTNNTTIRS